jgi:hypothetical protein
MSDDKTETDKLDKTPGQVGYEAMLKSMLRTGNEEDQLYAAHNIWENQCPKLHADWEDVGAAIVKVFGASETNSVSGCPNPSSVDRALTFADRKAADGWVTARDLEVSLRVLAAEVRRLRSENLLLAMANTDREELRAELVQVKADNEYGAMAYEDVVKALAERNRELAETKHLLAEERALTAATVGQQQTLWQAIDDAMAAGEGPVRWAALERIESAAYALRTQDKTKP